MEGGGSSPFPLPPSLRPSARHRQHGNNNSRTGLRPSPPYPTASRTHR